MKPNPDISHFQNEIVFSLDGFTAQLCISNESKEIAYDLRYRAYRHVDAVESRESEKLHDHHDEGDNTRIHLIWHHDKPVASVRSSIWAANYGYRETECVAIFREEVEKHLGLKNNILESSRYVVDPEFKGRASLQAQLLLFRIQDLSSRFDQCEHIITAVQEKHVPFYQRMLGFRTISDVKTTPWLDRNFVLLTNTAEKSRKVIEDKGMIPCTNTEVQRYFELCLTQKPIANAS